MKKFRFSLATVMDYKQQALDAIRSRYGADAVVRGSLLSGRSAPAQKAKKEQPKGNG